MQILIQHNLLFCCHAKKCWRIKIIKKVDNRVFVFCLLLDEQIYVIKFFFSFHTSHTIKLFRLASVT